MMEAYTENGGSVEDKGRSKLSLDFEAQLFAIMGDPFLENDNASRFRRLERDELNNGTF